MAATTIGDYNLVTELIDGYAPSVFTANLSLVRGGIISASHDGISFMPSQGNTWTVRGYQEYTATWDTFTAATDMTIDNLDTYKDIGVILRRGKAIGVEDASRYAGGDPENEIAMDIARSIGLNSALNVEKTIFTYLLPGLFLTNGPLRSSHTVVSEGAFSAANIEDALSVPGENRGGFTKLFMHSTVHKNFVKNELVSYSDVMRREYMESGLTYGGSIGGVDIILNDRCYNSGTTYHSYLMRPGGIFLGYQKDLNVEYDRQILTAGGTDVWKYSLYFSPHVPGVSFTGTAPTGISGATDANLSTVTNWTKRSGIDNSQIGIVTIESTEG